MTGILRIVLVIVSFLTAYWTFRKIRKSQLQIEDSIFWIFTAIILMIISLFPSIPKTFSKLIGIQSPSNFVFLSMIFILLVKTFMLTIKISQIENKVKSLVQEIGIRDKKIHDLLEDINHKKNIGNL